MRKSATEHGECDWNAGVPAFMSAKHEKARAIWNLRSFDVAEKRDVAGGDACVPVASAATAFRPHPPCSSRFTIPRLTTVRAKY